MIRDVKYCKETRPVKEKVNRWYSDPWVERGVREDNERARNGGIRKIEESIASHNPEPGPGLTQAPPDVYWVETRTRSSLNSERGTTSMYIQERERKTEEREMTRWEAERSHLVESSLLLVSYFCFIFFLPFLPRRIRAITLSLSQLFLFLSLVYVYVVFPVSLHFVILSLLHSG